MKSFRPSDHTFPRVTWQVTRARFPDPVFCAGGPCAVRSYGNAPALANGRASTHAKQSALEEELRATLGNGKVSTFRLHVWISTGTRLLWRYVCAACRCSTEKPSVSVHAGGGLADGSARGEADPKPFTAHHSSTKIPRRDQNLNVFFKN